MNPPAPGRRETGAGDRPADGHRPGREPPVQRDRPGPPGPSMGGRPSPRRRRQGLRHRNGSARAGHRAARTSAPAGPVPAAGARTASGSTGDSPRTAHHARGTGPAKAPAHARIPAVAGDTPRPLASTASSPARSPWGTGRVSRRARKPARSTLGHAPPCHGDHGLPPRSRGRAHPLQTGRTRPDVRPRKPSAHRSRLRRSRVRPPSCPCTASFHACCDRRRCSRQTIMHQRTRNSTPGYRRHKLAELKVTSPIHSR